ncbi:hypothetical protein MLD38_030776 [Melastoma candidum]|uniref:Uncharacterized protein n=1 Tax=Melastoma candidum TaxID=119954 RepID=A0ACB9MMQ7_9MYRT|nr:hypothetical protein MLD38_030776 [Melastoma candidum]
MESELEGKAQPRIDNSWIFGVVNPIIDDVHSRGGGAAVKEYTAKFDKVELDTVIDDVCNLPDPVVLFKDLVIKDIITWITVKLCFPLTCLLGPSEVLVIADKYANPVHIAADLLSQAERGPDSQVVLGLVRDGFDVKSIEEEITKQCLSLRRGDFHSKALSHSFIVVARDMVESFDPGTARERRSWPDLFLGVCLSSAPPATKS